MTRAGVILTKIERVRAPHVAAMPGAWRARSTISTRLAVTSSVIPAKAGIQAASIEGAAPPSLSAASEVVWIPAFAGMTVARGATVNA
jgi:hypothetical protein